MNEANAYKEKYEAKLDEWNAEISKMKAQANQKKSDETIELQKKIEDLESKHTALKKKLDELSDQGRDAWEALKSDIEKAGSDLSGSIKAATHKLDQ